MIRAIIQFDGAPDPERYRQHLDEFGTKVACDAFRHGKVFGSPFGEPKFQQYAEFEWDDMDAFKEAANSPEFAASGEDAMAMGVPFTVHFATSPRSDRADASAPASIRPSSGSRRSSTRRRRRGRRSG